MSNTTVPKRVCVTGAAGQIAYNLLPLLCGGEVLGANQPIILHLLDIPQAAEALKAVVMEIEDGAYGLVRGVVATTDVDAGFEGVEVAILLGGFPRLQGMTRGDLLEKNCAIFKVQGMSLAAHANKDCKVVVVANPANTNALIACTAANGAIPASNFTALTRLDQNRAVGQVAKKLGVGASSVEKMIIWGNHSQDQYPDLSHASFTNEEDKVASVYDALKGEEKFLEEFIPTIQQRGAAVIAARGKSSAMSAANATKDHVHSWLVGTKGDNWASMAVMTDGTQYGLPAGLVFSMPCQCQAGVVNVVKDLKLSDADRARLTVNVDKLTEEFSIAQKFL